MSLQIEAPIRRINVPVHTTPSLLQIRHSLRLARKSEIQYSERKPTRSPESSGDSKDEEHKAPQIGNLVDKKPEDFTRSSGSELKSLPL
ncbi:hypothetical protein C1H46_024674 [Malus baccata]|uniref:Uncharacterized protein n=1 Tax=Malus baccata TaxID=106549 RepID=A0A540LU35_MALBA|nr:hypothetical protein C1H46_024674 [Malus baccata]